jgi:hypothetical protein
LRRQVHEAARLQCSRHHPGRSHAHAQAGFGGAAHGVQAVGAQARGQGQAAGLAGVRVREQHFAAVVGAQREPGQPRQFFGMHGHGAALQQRGRRDHDAGYLREMDGHERRVAHLADLDGAVHAGGHEVLEVVTQQPFHRQARVLAQELCDRRHQLFLPESMRHHHAQQAFG